MFSLSMKRQLVRFSISTYQSPQRRPMDLACHQLETIGQEKTTRETSQAVERQTGLGDGLLRRLTSHGTLRLPNDDDDDYDDDDDDDDQEVCLHSG